MRRQEKYSLVFAGLLCGLFLCAALRLTAPPSGEGAYTVAAQRAAESAAVQRPLVNVNTAAAAELDTLTGVGETLAQRIVAYREEHGPFAVAEDLMKVRGIGEQTLAGFRHQITLEGE